MWLTISVLHKEHHGYPRERAFNQTFDVINFINSVIATIGSSYALYYLGSFRYNVSGSKSLVYEDWTIETVCGYITVELLLMAVSSYRLPKHDWSYIKERYKMMEIFHAVALTGLASVMYFNTGYPLAMWVIWTELTTVLMGVQELLVPLQYTRVHRVLNKLINLLFVLQRILLYFYLIWLSIISFIMEFHYFVQFVILIVGTVLNIIMKLIDQYLMWFIILDSVFFTIVVSISLVFDKLYNK